MMFRQVYSLDVHLFRLINGKWINSFLDYTMALAGDLDFWRIPLIVGAIALLIFGRFRERLFLVLTALALFIGDAGVVQGIRRVVERPRPYQTLENVRFVDLHGVEIRSRIPYTGGHSMPSGHVCNHTAVAYFLLRLYGPWASIVFIWVPFLAYSRVYTGSHYPSDALVSIFIGLSYAWLIFWVVARLWAQFAPRWCPSLYKRYPDLENLWRRKK